MRDKFAQIVYLVVIIYVPIITVLAAIVLAHDFVSFITTTFCPIQIVALAFILTPLFICILIMMVLLVFGCGDEAKETISKIKEEKK